MPGDVELEVRRDQVGQTRGLLDVHGQHLELVGEPRALRDERHELVADVARERRRLDRVGVARVGEHLDPAAEVVLVRPELDDARARHALHEQAIRGVGKAQHLRHAQHRADRCRSSWPGLPSTSPFTATDSISRSRPRHHRLDQLLAALGVDEERREQVREDDGVLERQDGQRVGHLDRRPRPRLLPSLFFCQTALSG